jgi:hypothetical protein
MRVHRCPLCHTWVRIGDVIAITLQGMAHAECVLRRWTAGEWRVGG